MSSGTKRFEFAERMRPIADKLYLELMPGILSIERFDEDNERHILDTEFAIDLKFTFITGLILTGQEKFREFNKGLESLKRPQYSDATVEFENDPIHKVKGDWFKLACQIYFVGFASKDEKRFDRYILLDWTQVVLETQRGRVIWSNPKHQSDGRAKASFRYAPFNHFPPNCVIARYITKP